MFKDVKETLEQEKMDVDLNLMKIAYYRNYDRTMEQIY